MEVEPDDLQGSFQLKRPCGSQHSATSFLTLHFPTGTQPQWEKEKIERQETTQQTCMRTARRNTWGSQQNTTMRRERRCAAKLRHGPMLVGSSTRSISKHNPSSVSCCTHHARKWRSRRRRNRRRRWKPSPHPDSHPAVGLSSSSCRKRRRDGEEEESLTAVQVAQLSRGVVVGSAASPDLWRQWP